MFKSLIRTGLALGILLSAAAMGHAITVNEVIDLAHNDAGDGVIFAKIDADQTVFQLTVDDILALKDAGVSDSVITYMINTGKDLDEDTSDPAMTGAEDSREDQEVQSDAEDYDGAEDENSGGGSLALGAAYSNTGFGVTVGYYYPSWPGYYYASYYDPFFWPNWGYYYSYCSPYPYWRWYGRHYACYTYSYPYWYRCSTPWPYYGGHHGHGYVHENYYDHYYAKADHSGRYTGSRGTPVNRRRSDSGDLAEAVANNRVISTPRRPSVSVVPTRDSKPAPSRGYTLRRPDVRARGNNGSVEVVTPRRVPNPGPRVQPRTRPEVHPRQPGPKVTPRAVPNSRRTPQPPARKRPTKVTKPKAKDNGDSNNRRPNVTPSRPAPSNPPKAHPAPSRDPGGRKPSGRRGGGDGH